MLSARALEKRHCMVNTQPRDPYDRSPDNNQDYTAYWINRA